LGIVVVVVVVVVEVVVEVVVVVGSVETVVVVVGAEVGVDVGAVAVVVGFELAVTGERIGKRVSVKVVGSPPPVEPDGEDVGVVVLAPWSCCDSSTSARRRAMTVEDVEVGAALVVVGDDAVTKTDGALAVVVEVTAFGVRTARPRGVGVSPESSASETPTAIRMQTKIREISALR
jgi:hypothetical protein